MDNLFLGATRDRSGLRAIEQDVLSICLGHNPTVAGAARETLINQLNNANSDIERAQSSPTTSNSNQYSSKSK